MSSSPRKGSQLTKHASVDGRHVNAPWGSTTMEIATDPKIVSNSPGNGPESAKTVTIYDRHVSAPWGSITMEIALGSQNGE